MSPDHSPRCEYLEQVSLHAVGALPANEATQMHEHLKTCDECSAELETLRSTVASFGSWPVELLAPSESLWGRLAERISPEVPDRSMPATPPACADPEWEEVGPGISYKLLSEDSENHRVSMLVRLAAGAAYPPHVHAGTEELHLLQGELWIDERKLLPGDYNRAEAGSADRRVWTETGCTCVLMTSTRDVLR